MENNTIVTQSDFKITKEDFFEIIRHLGTDVQWEVYDPRLIANYVCSLIEKIMNCEDNKILDKNIINQEKEFKYLEVLKILREKLSNFREDEEL